MRNIFALILFFLGIFTSVSNYAATQSIVLSKGIKVEHCISKPISFPVSTENLAFEDIFEEVEDSENEADEKLLTHNNTSFDIHSPAYTQVNTSLLSSSTLFWKCNKLPIFILHRVIIR